jgi:hypothetical protein
MWLFERGHADTVDALDRREEDMRNGIAALALLLCATRGYAITAGQVDDFEDGTVQNWTEGEPSPNPPTNIPTGGPNGADDNYLQNVSAGGSGSGSAQVMFNFTQWTGDYDAAGVVLIEADVANFGTTDLHMRIAFEGAAGTRYGSATAVDLPAGSGWIHARFEFSDLSLIQGSDPLSAVLANVTTLRLLSAAAGPQWEGDRIAATLGADNITALAAIDSDDDGIADDADNCILVANTDQRDADGDGFGSLCDPDLNNDCVVNFLDLGQMKMLFFGTDPNADLTGNGRVNFADLGIMKGVFFQPPGPSGVVDTCGI